MKTRIEKSCVGLAGEDYSALVMCDRKIQLKVVAIGAFVGLILMLSVLSTFYAFKTIFNSLLAGLILGFFFGWTLVNLYRLLLNTLSRNVLPTTKKKTSSGISYIIRLTSLVFFGVVVAKPIEHALFKDRIQTITNDLRQKDVVRFKSMFSFIDEQQGATSKSATLEIDKAILAQGIKAIKSNTYFVHSIRVLNRTPGVWFVTLVIILIFCLPTVFKRRIRVDTKYYKIKARRQISVIQFDYDLFKQSYVELLKPAVPDIEYKEFHQDPPFNTKLIPEFKIELRADDLVKLIHG